MRRTLVALLAVAAFPSSAAAAPVLVLGPHGHVSARNDPYVRGPAVTPAPARAPAGLAKAKSRSRAPSASIAVKKPKPAPVTVGSVLTKLYRTGAINQSAYRSYTSSLNQALGAERRLKGTRRSELDAVTSNLHQMAVGRALTPSRLPVLFQTLNRNRQWWTTGPLLSSGQRVEFTGSELVWEYYPGQGIQLQVLGTFGKADGLYSAGASQYGALTQLLAQMIPLAVQRGGGLTWEYYFEFDGGRPPWTSAMSQGTGLEALSRAYEATGNAYYLNIANQALPVFTVAPPTGVRVATPLGARYLQYSFSPRTSILNAFLQSLIGLYDYTQVSGNAEAAQLFAAGNAEAQAEVPHFDTGAWSEYQPGVEDDLSYHQLVTGFLSQLCTLTKTPVYCITAQHFQSYLHIPPVVTQLTFTGRARKAVQLRFRLSKISHVGIVVTQGTTTRFQTSATFGYGSDHFTIPALKHPGSYSVRLAATDLAGNFARITGTLQISR